MIANLTFNEWIIAMLLWELGLKAKQDCSDAYIRPLTVFGLFRHPSFLLTVIDNVLWLETQIVYKNMEFESSVKTPFLVTIWVYNQSTRMRGSPTPSLVWAVWPPACRTAHRLRLICPSYRATSAPPQLNSIKQKRRKIAQKTNLGHSDKRLKAPTPTTKNWERRQKLTVPRCGSSERPMLPQSVVRHRSRYISLTCAPISQC